MKFNSKICALFLALAMGAGMLAGCNSNKGGNTPQPPVKYLVNATDTADYSFAGLHEDKLYTEGESVSFTVSLLNDEKLISQVGYVSGSERNPLELINEAYSFEMPANNVTLFVTLRDVDRYEITYEGKLQVDGDPIVFGLKKNGAAQLNWTLSAVEGGEHVTIDDHTVTPVSQGSVTFAASMQGVEVARKEVTVEKSAYYTIADALADAWAQGGNFQDNTKSTKSEGKYKIRAKVVFMGSPYNSKVEILLDDGTGILDYQIGNQSTAITEFAVGDVIEIEEQVQNYYGLFETYSSAVRFAKKVTDVEIQTTPFVDVTTGAEFDTQYSSIAGEGMHKIVPMTVQAKGKLGDKQDATKHRYEVPGATHGLLATTKSVITLAWEENALYNFKGYLLNYNNSAEYSNFIALEQSKLAATAVEIDQEAQELSINNDLQLTYTTTPVGAGVNVSWSSDDTNVATVSDSGLVHAVAAGTATITLTVDGHTDTIVITVPAALTPVTAASFSAQSKEIVKGETFDLNTLLTITPEENTDSAEWTSSQTGNVTVADGVITGVAVGPSTITVRFNENVSATIEVTVRAQRIADLADAKVGDPVDVYGYITAQYPVTTRNGIWVNDGNRGIFLYKTLPSGMNIGDAVHIVGTVAANHGGKQVSSTTFEKVTDTSGLNIQPASAVEITQSVISSITSELQGAKATVTGIVKSHSNIDSTTAHHTIVLTVGNEEFKVYAHKDNDGATVLGTLANATVGAQVTFSGFVSANKSNCQDFTQLAKTDYQIIRPTLDSYQVPEATAIALNKTTANVEQGATLQLTASAVPAGATLPASIVWSVTGTAGVTVDQTGLVEVDANATPEETATITATCGSLDPVSCVITVKEAGGGVQPGVPVTVTKTSAELQEEHNWGICSGTADMSGNIFTSFDLDSYVQFDFVGTGNTATYWSNGTQVRVYCTAGKSDASITVSGKNANVTIVSVTLTFALKNSPTFPLTSGTADTVNAASKTYTVTGGEKNGQVQITQFSVTYIVNA